MPPTSTNLPLEKLDSPEAVLRAFLWFTIDEPNLANASTLLDQKSRDSNQFHGQGPPPGSKYSLGPATPDPRGVIIPVAITIAAEPPESLTILFLLIQEGPTQQWKIDLATSMESLLAPILKTVTTPLTDTLSQALSSVTQAFSDFPVPPADVPPADIPRDRVATFLSKELPSFQSEIQKHTKSSVLIDLDLDSLLYHPDPHKNRHVLDTLAGSIFNSLGYALREAHAQFPFKNRLAVVRLERAFPAPSKGRALFADGSRIIYRLDPASDDLYYFVDDLQNILPPLLASLPDHIDPRADNAPGPISWLPTLIPNPSVTAVNYRDHTLPEFANRISETLHSALAVDMDYASIRDAAALENLYIWGPSRLLGGLKLLAVDAPTRDLLASAVHNLHYEFISDPAHKTIALSSGTLTLRISLAHGESGSFYEHQIASLIRTKLHLAERPLIESIRREALEWQNRLDALFRHPIAFQIDFDGFLSHPQSDVNLRALHMLKEHGVDHLYYVVSNLAESNPNFKQQFRDRISALRLVHVPTPAEAAITTVGSTLLYKLHLHSGYTGYLTMDDLTDQIPALIAALEDQRFTLRDEREPFNVPPHRSLADDDEDDDQDDQSSDDEAAELAELRQLAIDEEARLAADDEKEKEDETEAESAPATPHSTSPSPPQSSAFEQMRDQMNAALPIYAAQFEQLLGKPIPFEIDWNSLDGDALAIGELLNAGLTPILGGLSILGSDAEIRRRIHTLIKKITLRRAAAAPHHGFTLEKSTLVYSAFLSKVIPATDPQLAATLLRTMLVDAPSPQSPAAKKTPPKKSPPSKPTPKSAPKKPAPKAPSKSKPKPQPKPPK